MRPNSPNPDTDDPLRALSPFDALDAWLTGDFTIGDEPTLLEAIRRDTRVRGPDAAVVKAVMRAMDEQLDAAACMALLVRP